MTHLMCIMRLHLLRWHEQLLINRALNKMTCERCKCKNYHNVVFLDWTVTDAVIDGSQVKCPARLWHRTPQQNLPWMASSGHLGTSWLWRRVTCPSLYVHWGSSIQNRLWRKSGWWSVQQTSLTQVILLYSSADCLPFFSQLLSIIGKTNIYLSLRGYIDAPAYPASEAALNIIMTGTTRQPELFYPWFTSVVALSKDWFPSITSYVVQNSYNYNPWKTFLCRSINAYSRFSTWAYSVMIILVTQWVWWSGDQLCLQLLNLSSILL